MDLQMVRNQINEIDALMKDSFHKRLACSRNIAEVKLSSDDMIYKPAREVEIYNNYNGDYKDDYILFIKIIMQISRRYQYGIFAENNKYADGFLDWYEGILVKDENWIKVNINTKASEDILLGLSVKDILLVVAGSSIEVESISAKDNEVNMILKCHRDDILIKKLTALCYLIYCETEVCK